MITTTMQHNNAAEKSDSNTRTSAGARRVAVLEKFNSLLRIPSS